MTLIASAYGLQGSPATSPDCVHATIIKISLAEH
jgi:hypothetical protein